MAVKPISPTDDRLKQKDGKRQMPDNIVRIINGLIIDFWDGRESCFSSDVLYAKIKGETGVAPPVFTVDPYQIFALYSEQWRVEYMHGASEDCGVYKFLPRHDK